MPRLITRHANRKLYDRAAKRYLSLAGIVDLVMGGVSVKVVEHPGGEDATPRILAQALVDLVRRRARSLPTGLMETLVRLAGGARLAAPPPEGIKALTERARREAEGIATRLVARGRLGIEEALSLREEVETAIHRGVEAAEAATRRPLAALEPGASARTIAGLARELKTLETLVPLPASPPSPKRSKRGRAAKSRHSSPTRRS